MTIIWSKKAKTSYEKTIDYLIDNWPITIAKDLEKKTNLLLSRIRINKTLCPLSSEINLRKCVIHKNTSLIYRIKKNTIEIVAFIDNRSNHNY